MQSKFPATSGSRYRIMQRLSHQCEHVMEVVRKFLVRPVPFPAAAVCEERVNGPTIRASAAISREILKQSLQAALER